MKAPSAWVGVFLFAACAAPPKAPFRPPALEATLAHLPGGILTAPEAAHGLTVPEGESGELPRVARPVDVEFFLLSELPAAREAAPVLDSLAVQLETVVAEELGAPVVAVSRLSLGARVGSLGDLSAEEFLDRFVERDAKGRPLGFEWQGLDRLTGRLVAGLTLAAALRPKDADEEAALTAPVELRLELILPGPDASEASAPPPRLELALVLEGQVQRELEAEDSDEDDAGGAAAPAETESVTRREMLLFSGSKLEDRRRRIALLPWPGTELAAVAVAFEIGESRPLECEELRVLLAELDRQAERAGARRVAPGSAQSLWWELSSAFDGLTLPGSRRHSLLFLADLLEAPHARDLALSASDDDLREVAAACHARLAKVDASTPLDTIGWQLEAGVFESFLALASGEGLSPELRAIAARNSGEAGRQLSFFEEVIAGAPGLEALEERIIQENRFFLRDSSPSARSRAFSWLGARGLAPPGFDPLASRDERRKVLATWEEARLAQAERDRAAAAAAVPPTPAATKPDPDPGASGSARSGENLP